jgi:hypothetical protein
VTHHRVAASDAQFQKTAPAATPVHAIVMQYFRAVTFID